MPNNKLTPEEQRHRNSVEGLKNAGAFVGLLYTMCPLVLIGLAVTAHHSNGTLNKLNWPFIYWITPVLVVGFILSASYVGPFFDKGKDENA